MVNNTKVTGNFLIIDLRRLTFTSSHGLGELISISNSLKKRSKSPVFFNPRDEIRSIVKISGIDTVITIVESEEELVKIIGEKNTLSS
jgi:anti-anti-sigma factor